MRIMRFLGRKLKFLVDVPAWMSYKDLRSHGSNIYQIACSVFKRADRGRRETFEEAVARLQLTEDDIKNRQQHFLYASLLYALIGLVLVIYSFYLLWMGRLSSSILAFVVTGIALALAYKESFCHLQVRQRRLGCTWRDWLRQFK